MTTQDAQHQSELNLLRESGLFQADYMLARSPALAASTLDSLSMKVFDFATQQWTQLQTGAVAFPEWSHDSRSLYYASWASTSAILRISSAGGKPERVASLKGEQYTGVYTSWMGLAPDDTPLMLRDRGSNDIYALTLEGK